MSDWPSDLSSPVWGGSAPITQGYGVNLPDVPDDWYAYVADWGLNYGEHGGIDVGVPKLTPIKSLTAGVVSAAGPSDSYRPNPVMVETRDPATGDDVQLVYGHLWTDAVRQGQTVKPGDLLGYSGEQTIAGTMTPDGSGPHLHLEVQDLTRHLLVDPVPWVKSGGAGTTAPGGGTNPYQLGFSLGGAWDDIKTASVDWGSRIGVGAVGLVALAVGAYVVAGGFK